MIYEICTNLRGIAHIKSVLDIAEPIKPIPAALRPKLYRHETISRIKSAIWGKICHHSLPQQKGTTVAASTVWRICIWLALSAGPAGAGEMWITNEKDHTVSVIDTKTQELKASYNVGLRPRGIIFAKDFSELYVCASDDDRIDVLDPETGVVIRSMPSGEDREQFALHPNNRYLYIAN